MRYAFLVAWREYSENAKTRGFWLGMVLVPMIFFLSIKVPILLQTRGTPVRYYVLVDQSSNLAPVVETRLERAHQRQVLDALQAYARKYSDAFSGSATAQGASYLVSQFVGASPLLLDAFMNRGGKEFFLAQLQPHLKPGAPPFKEPRRLLQPARLPADCDASGDLASLARNLRPYLRGDRNVEAGGQQVPLSAAVLIPRDIGQQIVRPGGKSAGETANADGIEYWSDNLADTSLRDQVEQAVNGEIRRREYVARGLDAAAVREVEGTYAPITSLNPKKEAGKEAVNQADVIRQWAPSAFVYLLWIAIFTISQMLLNNIIEEKSNRVIEVLLSSVTPGELMVGKLFGIAAVGLTMVGAWIAAALGILMWQAGGSEFPRMILLALRTSHLLPMFGVYFTLGYLMYAAVILSLGSVCNTIKEAQNYMGLITMTMMVPLLTMTFIPKDPNGVLARTLSWIPIYTPFAMMNRATADPPLFDLIGTMILLLLSCCAALWMAGKIFRIGILRTGQPPKIVEMLRWVRR
jgi:ABC-2 type transport system permease protein